jgi:hypothetical protein
VHKIKNEANGNGKGTSKQRNTKKKEDGTSISKGTLRGIWTQGSSLASLSRADGCVLVH